METETSLCTLCAVIFCSIYTLNIQPPPSLQRHKSLLMVARTTARMTITTISPGVAGMTPVTLGQTIHHPAHPIILDLLLPTVALTAVHLATLLQLVLTTVHLATLLQLVLTTVHLAAWKTRLTTLRLVPGVRLYVCQLVFSTTQQFIFYYARKCCCY